MTWFAVGATAVTTSLSIAGSMESNAALDKQARDNYAANQAFIERDRQIQSQELAYVGDQVNNELGMALTNLVYQSVEQRGQLATSQAETGVYGNAAVRNQITVAMREALTEDSLAQAANSKMLDVQKEFSNLKYETETKNFQNAQARSNTLAGKQSTLGIVSDAASVAFSTYAATSSVGTGSPKETPNTPIGQTQTVKAG